MKKHIITGAIGSVAVAIGAILSFGNFLNGPAQLEYFFLFTLGGCAMIKGFGDAVVELDERRHSNRISERKKSRMRSALFPGHMYFDGE